MYSDLSVFTGNANPGLAQAICKHLGVPLGSSEVFQFSNENIFARINETVREKDVFLVQSTCSPVSTSIMELLIMIDALKRASAARITAVIPYYAYGRTDKKDQPRVPITARLLADLIEVAGANRVLTMDLHAGQIQGFFSVPVDELTALPLLARHFEEQQIAGATVVAPDLGAAKRARNFAEKLDLPIAVIEKRRAAEGPQALRIIGDVVGRQAILIDDEIDTAASLQHATEALQEAGVTRIYACCTHPVLSGPAIDRVREMNVDYLVVTDTIPLPKRKQLDKIKVLSTAHLFAEAIRRIHTGESMGALFQ